MDRDDIEGIVCKTITRQIIKEADKQIVKHVHSKIKNEKRADNAIINAVLIAVIGSFIVTPVFSILIAGAYLWDKCDQG